MGEKVGKKLGEKVGEKTGENVGESLGEIDKINLCPKVTAILLKGWILLRPTGLPCLVSYYLHNFGCPILKLKIDTFYLIFVSFG